MRRGLGYGLGMGYKNLIPYDKHVHSMSARGQRSFLGIDLTEKQFKKAFTFANKNSRMWNLSDDEFKKLKVLEIKKLYAKGSVYAIPHTYNNWNRISETSNGSMSYVRGGYAIDKYFNEDVKEWVVKINNKYARGVKQWNFKGEGDAIIKLKNELQRPSLEFDEIYGQTGLYAKGDYNKQLLIGTDVEMEHTKNRMVAMKIAQKHLSENKDYYKFYDSKDKTAKEYLVTMHTLNAEQLPIYKIKGKFYYLDKRLGEYRNIKNPFDVLNYDNISVQDLQKPTMKDRKIVFGLNAKNSPSHFSFKGRYTLRGINGRWYVYDRELGATIEDTGANTFTKAEKYLYKKYPSSLNAKLNAKVDLNKYQGKWYDQASFPTWFDKQCKGQRAEYKVRPDGKVDVINTCLPSGRQVKGTARSVSKDNKNLKVSFFPFVEGDYNILYLDKGYKNVVVGSNSKNYLWILTRNKNIPKKELDKLIMIAKKKGYDTSKLKVMTLKASGSANIEAPSRIMQELKTPSVEVLSSKNFDEKFKDDYKSWEQGYATTKISPDGTTKVYVRDDGNKDYTKEGKLLMHELKEIEIFKNLVNNKHIDPRIADELAHNMNPVKIKGVSTTYPLDPNN